MELVIGRGAQDRERGAFPPWLQTNMLLEETATDPKQYNLLSRPPLASYATRGSGPINGIFYKPGLFAGALFSVSGGTLYKDGVSLGAINGTGPVKWAAGIDEVVLTRGQTAYSYNGTNLQAIAFPDGANVVSVHWASRKFYFVRANSGRFYWSELDDGRTIDGLNYANAESEQDSLLDIAKQGDVFWMMGVNTGEAWVLTGDPDLPLTRVVQRNLGRGVQATGCCEEVEGTVYFISSDGMVCRILDASQRVSSSALEEKIRKSATGSTYLFQYEGKVLLCLRLDAGTYALDLALDHQPLVLSTYGRMQWAPKCAIQVGSEVLFGDDTNGTIWQFDPDSSTDSGQAQLEKRFSAGLPVGDTPASVSNIIVQGNSGDTSATTGEASDPPLEMRFSRDGGREWSAYRSARWGSQGEYRRRARYGSCGMFGPPGFLAEFRMMAVVPLRIASVRANESLAGRGL
jgi:hypothetical protein